LQAVVSDQPGKALFYVGMPKGGEDRADQWYGQAIAGSYEKPRNKTQELYEGLPVIELKSGWKSIEVQAVTLGGLLRDLDRVDLIDMDVQGAELKVVRAAIDALDQKVCRLHIGTHAHDLEKGLKETLGSHGWICHFDFPCLSKTETAFGLVSFDDGVQSWTNPRFQ
jgi:FkbM family methyltransferase